MINKNLNYNLGFLLILICGVWFDLFFFSLRIVDKNERKINNSSVETYTIPWLKNSNFSSDEAWSVIKEGGVTDVSER